MAAEDFENGEYDGHVEGKGGSEAEVSAHTLGQDNPWEVGFQLAMAVDNAFILGYPLLVMAFLGWVLGLVLFIAGGLCTLYANVLLANLAVIDGKRYYRFRDIAAVGFGTLGFWFTAILQWLNILAGNVGLVILAGEAAQGVYAEYHNFDTGLLLPEWITITGALAIVVALVVPDLHYLRFMSIVAALCSLAFVTIIFVIATKDGNNATEPRNYTPGSGESSATKYFNALGTLGTVAFAYTTCIMPEIQATVREPCVTNFYKSMSVSYFIGAPIFIAMSATTYWAYGNSVSFNVMNNLSGPKWAVVVGWVCVFVQCIVSLQIYSAPIYETIDTYFNREGGPWTPYNTMVRVIFRIPYVVATSLVAAMLPFFGDFVALIGSLTVLPCNFVFTFLLHVTINKGTISGASAAFHYFLAALFAVITVVTSTAAVRYIYVDAVNYSLFANF